MKKLIYFTTIIFLVCSSIILVLFTTKFYKNGLSSNISDWSLFGDFFGGVFGPLIALFGTVILAFISYQVSNLGSKENKNLFILEQKILAYQNIATLKENLSIIKFALRNSQVMAKRFSRKSNNNTDKYESEISNALYGLAELEARLINFPLAYGHLFEYDFTSEEFYQVKEAFSHWNSQTRKIIGKEVDEFDPGKYDINILEDFFTKLKTEIEIEEI